MIQNVAIFKGKERETIELLHKQFASYYSLVQAQQTEVNYQKVNTNCPTTENNNSQLIVANNSPKCWGDGFLH